MSVNNRILRINHTQKSTRIHMTEPWMTETRPYFLHMVQFFLGWGLWEKAERQGVEQKRCEEPLRWYAVWPFFSGFLQLAQVTLTVRGGCWEPPEPDWPGGLAREAAGEGESTPGCFWFRGNDADWEIQESVAMLERMRGFRERVGKEGEEEEEEKGKNSTVMKAEGLHLNASTLTGF